MTTEHRSNIEGIIEDVGTKRYKNAAVRFRLTLSLPVNGNEQLYLAATKNIGNVVEATLRILQAELLPPEGAPGVEADDSELDGIFSAGEPQAPSDSLVGNLIAGAQAQSDEDRAQAMSNLQAQGQIPPDPEEPSQNGHAPRRRRGMGTGAQLRDE